MIEDVLFLNKLYTQISDIKIDNDISSSFLKKKEDSTLKDTFKNIKNNKSYKIKKNNKNYICMILIFYFLNSSFVINIFNLYNINYSLIYRTTIFIILYYFI
jgi:hypothetical protein